MKHPLTIGLEIEAVVNAKVHSLDVGNYHEGNRIEGLYGWRVERDGSIRSRSDTFEGNYYLCEFVSNRLIDIEGAKSALKRFQDFISKQGTHQLREVIRFNSSCGAHIHFSFNNTHDRNQIHEKILKTHADRMRAYCFNLIAKSPHFTTLQKEDICRYYDRRFSRVVHKKENWTEQGRYSELNFESAENGQGLEWRSPNLLNINTWEQFNALYDIYFKSLRYLVRIMNHKQSLKDAYKYVEDEYAKEAIEETRTDQIQEIRIEEIEWVQHHEIDIMGNSLTTLQTSESFEIDANNRLTNLMNRIRNIQQSVPELTERERQENEDREREEQRAIERDNMIQDAIDRAEARPQVISDTELSDMQTEND